jgi:PPP family 3-phenylpropionic acid transporter
MIRFWFKLFYAVKFAGIGVFMPYMVMYLIRKDLNNIQIGYLMSLTTLASIIVQPVWGIISDKFNMTRLLVTIGCWTTCVFVLGFTLTDRFEYLVVIIVLSSILNAPVHSNVAALALSHLESRGKQEEFGKFRLWGSIGFIVATAISGGLFFEDNLTITVYLYSGSLLVLGLISLRLPDRHISTDIQWIDGLRLLADNRQLRLFLVGIIFVGITVGISDQYLVIYMNELNASAWIVGATIAVTAVPEIPLMNYAETFIRKWGLRLTYIAAISALPVRWLFNILVTDPNIALPVQALHGVAMSALLAVGVIYIDNVLPKTLRASGQAIYSTSLYGLGPSIGLFIAGLLMGSGTTKSLWILCLFVGLTGCIIINNAMRMESAPTR